MPSSYRHIFNLINSWKFPNKLFLSVLQPHILNCSAYNHSQSSYRPQHWTESVLLPTLDNIDNLTRIRSWRACSILVFFDSSATISHSQVIFANVCWYLWHRLTLVTPLFIKLHASHKDEKSYLYHIPSYLGCATRIYARTDPLFISLTEKLAADHKLNHKQFADDTQLFILVIPSNLAPLLSQLKTCLFQLH